jgi:hypothetical protein
MTLDKSIYNSINTTIVNKIPIWRANSAGTQVNSDVVGFIYSSNHNIVRETVSKSLAKAVASHIYACICNVIEQCETLHGLKQNKIHQGNTR